MQQYGETIYGTRGGPVSARPWGVTTAKQNWVFVHILDWQDRNLPLPPMAGKIKSAKLFVGGQAVPFLQTKEEVILILPTTPTGVDTVVELVF
jgi:alpha-L-fucosidase